MRAGESSGQLLEEWVDDGECDNCAFNDSIDFWFDPEIDPDYAHGKCPDCNEPIRIEVAK